MSGWTTKKLGEIGTIVRGKGIRRSETISKGMPCIRYGEIYTSYDILLDEPHSFVTKEIFDACPHIKHGDVVFTLTGENKEEIAKTLAYLGDEEIAAGGDLAIWKAHGFNAKFLAYVMNSPQLLKAKAFASNGDIIVHVSLKKMAEIPIPIPPLAEQKRIVAKIDAAFEKIDRLKANAEKNLANAKELFQSALDEAFKTSKGDKVRLRDVCDVLAGYPFKGNAFSATGIKICGGLIITPTEIKWSECKYWNSSEGLEDYLLAADDIVIALDRPWIADGFKIGMIEENDLPCLLIQRTARLRAKKVIPKYLLYVLRHPAFTGATVPHISHKDIERYMIPCPPLTEQKQIAKRLDLLSQKTKALQQNYAQLIADCAEMRQTILREAFEGRMRTRRDALRNLAGSWIDSRATDEIAKDIERHRTAGRRVKL